MENKKTEEYEDVLFDTKDEEIDANNDIEEEDEEIGSEESNELKTFAQQLSKDYSNYFKFNITSEVIQSIIH